MPRKKRSGRLRLRLTLCFFLIVLLSDLGHAQSFEKEGRFVDRSRGLTPSYSGTQPFHVLHYALRLKAGLVTEELDGAVTITIAPTAPIDTLALNSLYLVLDTLRVNGAPAAFTVDPLAELVHIQLGRLYNPGDTVRIDIAYRRLPGGPRASTRQGYYFFSDTLGLPSNLGYTMSEPSDARLWMPCYDQPWEKAPADLEFTVPEGYVAASNGRLLGVTPNGDGTVTWRWTERHPIATYLMCMTASGFTVSTLPFLRAPGDTVPVQYYLWPADSSAGATYLPTVVQMLGTFSRLYGSYPFDKYGMSGVVPFTYGGMEHQTMTTLNRYLEFDESVVSHELSHQWWGDLVTCGTWADVWLNEGFASYSEALWAESRGGHAALENYMKTSFLHFFFGSWLGAVYDPVSQGFNLFDDVVYSKAAWALHMLRGVVGDSTFFQVLHAYRAKFAGRSAITSEFAAVADSVAGTSLEWFFNEWIYGPGWPDYTASFVWRSDTLSVTLSQTQSFPVFRMPVTFRAYCGTAGTSTFTVTDTLRAQTFAFVLPVKPDSVVVDPDGWLLGQITQSPATGTPATAYALYQNYPNPFNGPTRISYAIPLPEAVTISVFDILGRRVAILVQRIQAPGVYNVDFDGAGLASGVYFYRIEAGGFAASRKMLLIH